MTSTVKGTLQGAAAGAIMGGVQGFYGTNFSVDRIPATAIAGGLGSQIQGGSFKRGFEISGGVAALTWTSLWMRRVMVENSSADPRGYNSSGKSGGLNGDRHKLGGGRWDPTFGLEQVPQPFGGVQGEAGKLFGVQYTVGSWQDRLIEAFAGPHDWFGSWWGYAAADGVASNGVAYFVGDYVPSASVFGQYLGRFADKASSIMAGVDLFLAAPVAAGGAVGTNAGGLATVLNKSANPGP
jgi:hypothetical protein